MDSSAAQAAFDALTEQAVRNVQTTSALAITGQLDSTTWATLLRFEPKAVDWTKGRAAARSAARSGALIDSGPAPAERAARSR